MSKIKSNVLNMRVSRELYKRISQVAHDNGLNKSDVAREVLERHFLQPETRIVGEVVPHPELGNVIKFYGKPGEKLKNVVGDVGNMVVSVEEL